MVTHPDGRGLFWLEDLSKVEEKRYRKLDNFEAEKGPHHLPSVWERTRRNEFYVSLGIGRHPLNCASME